MLDFTQKRAGTSPFVMPAQAGIQWRRILHAIVFKWIPAPRLREYRLRGNDILGDLCTNHSKMSKFATAAQGHQLTHEI